MSSPLVWDIMLLCVPTRLMTKPHFQRTRQEEARGSVMNAKRRDMKLTHLPTRNVSGLSSSTKRLFGKVASKMQEKKANKDKSRLCYTCREKGHLSVDCPMGNTPKLNSSIDSNMLRRSKMTLVLER